MSLPEIPGIIEYPRACSICHEWVYPSRFKAHLRQYHPEIAEQYEAQWHHEKVEDIIFWILAVLITVGIAVGFAYLIIWFG